VVSFPELTLLFIIGLLVLGPERLPRVASQIGRWVGRARRTANQLRYQLEREIALADLEKSTKEKNQARRETPENPDAKTPDASGDAPDMAESATAPESESTAMAEPTATAETTESTETTETTESTDQVKPS
jgi:sec-independent protein translocase protein TatB